MEILQEYGDNNKRESFHLVLYVKTPFDSAISHNFTKSNRLRQDVIMCCREAVKTLKDRLKNDAIGKLCPYKQIVLTRDNIDIHHGVVKFADIADGWIKENGGIDALHKFVNPSINGGAITKFKNDEIRQSFIEYHNKYAHLVAISREAHKEIHQKK